MTVDSDIDGQDSGDFYCMWRGDEEIPKDEGGGTGIGEGEGKSDLLDNGVVIENQRFLGGRQDLKLLTLRRT